MIDVATESYIKTFDLSWPEEWEVYAQKFKVFFFLEAHSIANIDKQRSNFLLRCGSTTFQLARPLVVPAHLKDTALSTILSALLEHLALKPFELARRYDFYPRNQVLGELAAGYLVALHSTI